MAVSGAVSRVGENWLQDVSTGQDATAADGRSCDAPVNPPVRSRRRSLGEWYRMQADADQDESALSPDAEADLDQNESFLPPDAEVIHLDTPRGERGAASLDHWSEERTINLLEPLSCQQSSDPEMNAPLSSTDRPNDLAATEHSDAVSKPIIRESSTEVDSNSSVAHDTSSETGGSELSTREDLAASGLHGFDIEEVANAEPTFDQSVLVQSQAALELPRQQHEAHDPADGLFECDTQVDVSLKGRFKAVLMEFIEDLPSLW
eukprot:TRINITY_DN108367_c0_g1_i1.p1 TRINITY_DN108367_c0_g1~~TRINITY_DN108367_c0_g1_i1.p1  ORF type:complete len:263 (+),score=35.58 TRINITY_DN108367_c0_g1_i1:29-817(+)